MPSREKPILPENSQPNPTNSTPLEGLKKSSEWFSLRDCSVMLDTNFHVWQCQVKAVEKICRGLPSARHRRAEPADVGKCTDCSTSRGRARFQKMQCLYQLDKVPDQGNHKSSSEGGEPGWEAAGAAVGDEDKGYWRSSTAGASLLAQNCCCIPWNHSLSSSWACHILFRLLVLLQGVRLICLLGFAVYLHLFSA